MPSPIFLNSQTESFSCYSGCFLKVYISDSRGLQVKNKTSYSRVTLSKLCADALSTSVSPRRFKSSCVMTLMLTPCNQNMPVLFLKTCFSKCWQSGKIIILPETHQKLRVRLGVVTNDGLNPRGSPGLCVHQTPEMSDDVYFKCETS